MAGDKGPARPVLLQLNNSGAWKTLGTWDISDDDQTALVLDAAEDLIQTLHNSEDPKRCPTLRVAIDATNVLLRWDITRGWYVAATGESA